MAVYETEHDRIVLRVVYDGPGRVGKTTNVEQLALAFVGEHRPDPQDAPRTDGGRTHYFDWFCFDGGKLDGHALQIQIVGVPGPKRFEARRAHLLRSADVVVLVCDSTLAAQELARETLVSQREHLGALADEIPLVVQANKQDIHQALLPHEVGLQLMLPFEVAVLGAQASAGIGVRETMVQAVRAAVRRIKRHITRNGIASLAGKAVDAEALRADLDRLASAAVPEDGPPAPPRTRKRGASRRTVVREPKLVHIRAGLTAQNHGELSDLASRDDDPDEASTSEPFDLSAGTGPQETPGAADLFTRPSSAADLPAAAVAPDLSVKPGSAHLSPGTASTRPPSRLKARQTFTLSPEPDDPPLPDLSPRQTFTLSPVPDDPPLPDLSPRPGPLARPPTARQPAARPPERRVHVPPHNLSSGTDAAADAVDRTRLAEGVAVPASLHARVEHAHGHEHELVQRPTAEESLPPLPRADVPPGHVWPIPRGREILRGLVDLPRERLPAPPRPAGDPPLIVAVAGWRLCTRPSQRFATVEAAHAALVERVRQTRPCVGLLASDLVLVVQPEADGGGRLWHVAPRLDGIREHLALRPPQARPRVLAALAATIVGVLRVWLRHQVALELNLSAFAVEAGRVVHLGDPLTSNQTQLGTALLGFCERLSGDAAALAAFTAALEQELSQLAPDERTHLDLETALVRAETRYQDAHIARSRLLAALREPT